MDGRRRIKQGEGWGARVFSRFFEIFRRAGRAESGAVKKSGGSKSLSGPEKVWRAGEGGVFLTKWSKSGPTVGGQTAAGAEAGGAGTGGHQRSNGGEMAV